MKKCLNSISFMILGIFLITCSNAQNIDSKNAELDKKVEAFLKDNRGNWRDMNVPASDGQLLYDLIIKNNYTQALEIGTSTGHSGVWIAWALSKTGGKLITIDIDESRHKEALENFKKANGEIFNIAAPKPFNYHDFSAQIAQARGVACECVEVPGLEPYEISWEKAGRLLGYSPQNTMEDMVAAALALES